MKAFSFAYHFQDHKLDVNVQSSSHPSTSIQIRDKIILSDQSCVMRWGRTLELPFGETLYLIVVVTCHVEPLCGALAECPARGNPRRSIGRQYWIIATSRQADSQSEDLIY